MTQTNQQVSLTEALDRIEIQHVIASYSQAIDSHDWDALDRVFTPDAVIDYTELGGIRGDLPTIKKFLETSLPRYPRTQHLLGQSYVEIDGDTAFGRTACFNPMVLTTETESADEQVYFVGLWYRDVIVRTPEGWRISSRYEERTYKFNKPRPVV